MNAPLDFFTVGDAVEKDDGYPFPGIVRALFRKGDGSIRVVVEHEQSPGLLHIFAPAQLRRRRT